MKNTKDKNNPKGLFALFKGQPNTGKSDAAYSFPNPFVFDFDKKMPTIANKHFPNKSMDWETWPDVFALSEFTRPWMDGSVQCPYETLIVDSITALSTLVLLSVDKTKGTNVIEMMKHKQVGAGGIVSVEVMGIDYYNNETNFFERYFMQMLKTLWTREGNPKHVIVIAHEMVVESAPDLKTGIVRVTKSILTAGRKAAVFIPSRFDDEYLFTKEPPKLGETGKDKFICRTYGKDNARCGYNFPETIDFTDRSLFDILDSKAHWSSIGSDDSDSLTNKLTIAK